MNRKDFLRSGGLLAAASLGAGADDVLAASDEPAWSRPPYLVKGDRIGITAPAGYITLEDIQPAIRQIESWGYRVKIGDTIGKRDFTFGGTDEERLADLQRMLDDPEISAILSARGGYGSVRIADKLRWEKFRSRPKWVVGFSDLTVLHSYINSQLKVASIHSKMCNSFPQDPSVAEPVQLLAIESIRQALAGEKMTYPIIASPFNRQGMAEGVLVGGNLKTIETMAGTMSDLLTAGHLLFVEDTGEYLYSIDRMFWNLKRTGKLNHIKGLIIGGFKVKTDAETEDFGMGLEQIVLEKVSAYDIPVCFDFPVGHQKNNFALKCGIRHRLSVEEGSCTLTEIR